MLQKEIRSVEVKIVENKLQKFVAQAFSKDSAYHSLLISLYASIIGAIEPFVQNWINNNPEPSLKQVLQTVVGAILVTVGSYITKNGFNGSSNTTAEIKSPPQS